MINFTLTSDGQSLLASAVAGSNPVIIDAIDLKDANGNIVYSATENDFSGAVVADGAGLGDYIVLQFEDSRSNSYTVSNIDIKSGGTVVAISEAISLTKNANTTANFRVSAQFDGASKCACKNTVVNLPYATQNRDGIIRFAKTTGEQHKERTVYSAQDVEALVAAGVAGTDKYVPWDTSDGGEVITGELTADKIKVVNDYDNPASAVAMTVTSNDAGESALNVDGYISGKAVASAPAFGDGSMPSGLGLVNEDYIAALYSDHVAGSDGTPTSSLVSGAAVDSYVNDKLSKYVTLGTEQEIAGKKTFSEDTVFTKSVVSPSYVGDGVYAAYDASTWSSAEGATSDSDNKLPTVSAVRAAISAGDSAVTSAFQQADLSLQSQIDALNAGQNLADMVESQAALDSLDTTNLESGDKVQVLKDEDHGDASTVYRLVKTESSDGSETVEWEYIGEYGQDSYTKSEADELFVENSQIKQAVDSAKADEIPSSAAVATYVSNAISTASGDYVTLATEQTITGEKTFENTVKVVDPDNEKHSLSIYSGTTAESGTTRSSITCFNEDKLAMSSTMFECSGGQDNLFYRHELYSYTEDGSATRAWTSMQQTIMEHYGVVSSDLVLTASSYHTLPNPHAEARFELTGEVEAENYQERIRLRKTQSVDNPDDVRTYIDLYADHITNVGDDIHFKTIVHSQGTDGVLTTSTEELLTISNEKGVYSSKFAGGYVINGQAYAFGPAGSLDVDTAITAAADNLHAPTSAAVKSYVSEAITNSQDVVLTSISNANAIGSMGLFLYADTTDAGQKSYGELIDGAHLKPVGMSLPNSGQISYKSVALEAPLTGSWKLLSVAMKRTATEPCLVLAQKVSE